VNQITSKNRSLSLTNVTRLDGGTWCDSATEYTVVEGFGFPNILSQYKDPYSSVRTATTTTTTTTTTTSPDYNHI